VRSLVRVFTSAPGFAAVAVFTIAIAIGANTALFSVMNAVVLRPLDFPQPDSIVRYWARNQERNLDAPVIFWNKWLDLQANQTVFSHLAISVFNGATVTDGGEPEQVPTLLASSDFLPLLGLTPTLGRVFTAAEDKEGAPHVALISQRLWEQRYGRSPDVLGRTVTLDGTPHTIIGVLPRLPVPFNTPEVIHPRPYEVSYLGPNREFAGVWQVTARLKPGVSLAAAEAQVLDLHKRFIAANPAHPDATNVPRLRLLADEVYGNLNATFWVLAGAVAAVLLIACANIANLSLARVSARRKEIAVRLSLGATRAAIIRQFLGESLALTVAASAVGLLLAGWSLQGIQTLAGPQLPRAAEITLDPVVFAFAVGLALVGSLLVGLYPALQASRTDVGHVLKDTARGAIGGTAAKSFRGLLVIGQVALSLCLLICAGLLVLSFLRLQAVRPGFEPAGRAYGNINLPAAKYSTPELVRDFYARAQARLRAAPDFARAALTANLPLAGGGFLSPYLIQGRPVVPFSERPLATISNISADYFPTVGITLAAGRAFTDADRADTPQVAIINQTLAKKLFPGADPLDHAFVIGPNSDIVVRIVGVVHDVKTIGLNLPSPDEIYFPLTQRGPSFCTVVAQARPGLAASTVIPALRRVLAELDPHVALAAPQTMDQLVEQSLGVQRLTLALLLVFAGLAALLAAVGLYSVMAYAVTRRTGEIGVRLALGASPRDIFGLVLRAGGTQVGLGLALGFVASLGATRLLGQALFEVKPFDPLVYTVVALAFAAIAALACLIPARRAMQVDPLVALRTE